MTTGYVLTREFREFKGELLDHDITIYITTTQSLPTDITVFNILTIRNNNRLIQGGLR